MTENEVREVAKELMIKTPAAYLATIDGNGWPHIRAVENLRCQEKFPHAAKVISEYDKDDLVSYISTNTSSKKITQVLANSSVAIYYCNPEKYKGIMLQGSIEIVDDLEFKKRIWTKGWERYYSKGYEDPDFTMLRLRPKYMKGWYNFGIHELSLIE